MADRANTMPPQYAILNERPISPGYNQGLIHLVATLGTNKPASPEGLQAMCQAGITYVYIGQQQGMVGNSQFLLFSPTDFDTNPHFESVYSVSRVRIYRLDTKACQP